MLGRSRSDMAPEKKNWSTRYGELQSEINLPSGRVQKAVWGTVPMVTGAAVR